MLTAEDANNVWRESPDKGHSYLMRKMPPEKIAAAIEELMLQPPPRK